MTDRRKATPMQPIDLLQVRCSVAALVQSVEARGMFTSALILTVDAALVNLELLVASGSAGKLSAPIRRLLDPADDPGGHRTVGAIDALAALTRVDPFCAPALARLVKLPELPGRLFDRDDPDLTVTIDPDETTGPSA